MAKRTLKIRVGEKGKHLEISTLITVLQDTVGTLRGIDNAITGKSSPSLHWFIRHIEMNSPLEATLEAEVIKTKDNRATPEVVRPFLRGVKEMDKAVKQPRYFSEAELTRVKRIVDLQSNGVAFVEFSTNKTDAVRPSLRVANHIESILGSAPVKPYHQAAEIEGRLEDVSLHPEVPQFAVYDPLTDQPTECEFDEKDIDRVAGLMKRKARVLVSGIAKYNSRHFPVSIIVESLEEMPEQSKLPQIDDLHSAKINLTDGLDAVTVVRKLRDGR